MLTRSSSLAAAAFALVSIAGCGHALHYSALNPSPRPLAPRSPESVELFMAARPTRPFVDVGLFEIEERVPGSGGSDKMIAKVRARAAQVGCDALMIGEPTERVQSVTGQSFGTVQQSGGPGASYGTYQGMNTASVNVVRGQRAVCVVYTDSQAAPQLTGAEVSL